MSQTHQSSFSHILGVRRSQCTTDPADLQSQTQALSDFLVYCSSRWLILSGSTMIGNGWFGSRHHLHILERRKGERDLAQGISFFNGAFLEAPTTSTPNPPPTHAFVQRLDSVVCLYLAKTEVSSCGFYFRQQYVQLRLKFCTKEPEEKEYFW